jgi:hypothetical protein
LRRIALFALVALFSSCRSAPPAPSSLQRFDALRYELATVTSASVSVGGDVKSIGECMTAADTSGARSAALRLRRDAGRLSRQANVASARLRPISLRERNPSIRTYFNGVLATLAAQSIEGRNLVALSSAVRIDPLLLSQRDLHEFRGIAARGRGAAASSVYHQRRALRLRRKYRALFRYVPVRSARTNV